MNTDETRLPYSNEFHFGDSIKSGKQLSGNPLPGNPLPGNPLLGNNPLPGMQTNHPRQNAQAINVSDTRLPNQYEMERVPNQVTPNQGFVNGQSRQYQQGEYLGGSYIVNSKIEGNGKQADVYIVKKWGKSYVAKVYLMNWRPSEKLSNFLKTIRHPNLINVIETGVFGGKYYEIYDYYTEGTLEDKKTYSLSFLRNVVIPGINEGLNELHKNGIVHCDIKPSNIFVSNDQKSVMIGDFGLSDYVNVGGSFINAVRGTPEYSPPVLTLQDAATMTSAYDYGAFGLVLCRLATGHSLLGGMSLEEIAMTWNKGLEIPSSIDPKLRELIRGLVNMNEEERFGYKEVKRWCEGEFLNGGVRRTRMPQQRREEKRGLVFGKYNGDVILVETMHELAEAIKKNWDQARVVVKRRELTDFIKQFDLNMSQEVNKLSFLRDVDEAVFRLLYLVENTDKIYFRGKNFGTFHDYVSTLKEETDQDAVDFATSGLLVHFLRIRKMDSASVEKLEKMIKATNGNDIMAIKSICYLIMKSKPIVINNREVCSINDFIECISMMSIVDIDSVVRKEDTIAWLYTMGFGQEAIKLSNI